jgi:hypothetical protein
MYVFMSFGNVHTGKNIGCCIVQVDDPDHANDKCAELGLMPTVCNEGRGYVLTEESFNEQGMELNKFYSATEMEAMGFSKA